MPQKQGQNNACTQPILNAVSNQCPSPASRRDTSASPPQTSCAIVIRSRAQGYTLQRILPVAEAAGDQKRRSGRGDGQE